MHSLFYLVRWNSRILLLLVVVALMVVQEAQFAHGKEEQEYADDGDMRPRVAPMIPSECNSALSMISGNDEYSIFSNAIHETGMDSVYGSVRLRATVFIPTNKAIVDTLNRMSLVGDAETDLFKDFDTLHALVRHHVIPYYSMTVGDMEVGACYDTMVQGECIEIGTHGGQMVLSSGSNNATIDMADLNQGCPTVFHTISGFLIPDA